MLKENLSTLQQKLPKNTISLSPITGTDLYYTDGMASSYQYRLQINEGIYVKFSAYVNTKECLAWNFIKTKESTVYENIIQEWISTTNQTTR